LALAALAALVALAFQTLAATHSSFRWLPLEAAEERHGEPTPSVSVALAVASRTVTVFRIMEQRGKAIPEADPFGPPPTVLAAAAALVQPEQTEIRRVAATVAMGFLTALQGLQFFTLAEAAVAASPLALPQPRVDQVLAGMAVLMRYCRQMDWQTEAEAAADKAPIAYPPLAPVAPASLSSVTSSKNHEHNPHPFRSLHRGAGQLPPAG